MSTATRDAIRSAVGSIPASATNATTNRVNLALFMTMTSPDFLVQK